MTEITIKLTELLALLSELTLVRASLRNAQESNSNLIKKTRDAEERAFQLENKLNELTAKTATNPS